MSARDNILAKLRKANAYPMAEPQTFDYYQEMSPEWESETDRLRHWAATMRAVKTEIFWVREHDWEQKLVEVAQQKGLQNMLLSPQTGHGRRAQAALQAASVETRSQSLVPPVHICLFDTRKMYDTFHAALHGEALIEAMPTNIILVSGPSKTADIQLTLAYGAHGPRDMVVLAILPENIDPADLENAA